MKQGNCVKNLNLYAERKMLELGHNMKSSMKFSLKNIYRN